MLGVSRLSLLYEFASHGSIRATAVSTGQTPSAVSQQLRALEDEVGVALLERTARSARLTDAGRRLVEHAGAILDAIAAAEADVASVDATPQGEVTVSATPSVAVALAGSVLKRLRRYKKLTLVLRQQPNVSEAEGRVKAGQLDIALIDDWTGLRRSDKEGPLTYHYLLRDPLMAVLPKDHPLAANKRVSLRQLAGQPWIASPEGEPSRLAMERLWRRESIAAPLSVFEGLDTILMLVAKGLGVTVAPWMATLERKGIVVRPLVGAAPGREIYAVHRTASTGRPSVMTVLQALHHAARVL
ncbi:LysR family transcriptional regulator [Haloglycomyces albus]|uniref:LysR family transcriptional regulator n=1 Tax=Haloglycomyces albus TaxID=526067 RepID=UPI00046D6E9A|nr:LysR family transcriptional regulator [Haloglycomyces albus]